MFDKDYTFKGKHANIVTQLTAELDSETKFKFFDRNIDVLIIAPIVGYLYGRMSKKDDTGQITSDNIKKINFDQMNRESRTLNYNYELIMLLHNKSKDDIDTRLDRAFRYENGSEEKEECYKIFEEYGETYFRNCETNLLIELQKKNNQIISCGGGVALRDENVAEMKKNGKVVLLTASPEVILERVKDNDDRPLLRGNKNTEFISNMMEQRRPKYEAAADVVVNTDYKTVEEIAEEIVVKLTRDAD